MNRGDPVTDKSYLDATMFAGMDEDVNTDNNGTVLAQA